MVIVWSMAALGVLFTFGLAAVRAAEGKKFAALMVDGERK